jgi:limonene-1,2-epoxide hydrolase
MTLPPVAREFLNAVERRDATAVAACFTEDASYAIAMPHPALEGRAAIESALVEVFGEVDATRWDVVTAGTVGDLVYLERVDRFWFGGMEASIECIGVIRIADGRIAEIRDYADVATWRERKALAQGQHRDEFRSAPRPV